MNKSTINLNAIDAILDEMKTESAMAEFIAALVKTDLGIDDDDAVILSERQSVAYPY